MGSNQFEGMTEAKRPQIKFGKVGDWFKGVVTSNSRRVENRLSQKHEMQTVYEFKALGGSFHDIIDRSVQPEASEVVAGEFYSYFAKGAIEAQLKNAKLGQIIGMSFVEERPSSQPGMNPTKIIKVYLGELDPEYQGEESLAD